MNYPAHKTCTLTTTKAAGGAPDAGQLEQINRIALDEMTGETVYVRTAYLAHNAIDRDRDVFDDVLLAEFANTLPGKGLFIKHPRGWDGDTGPGVGRWFAASVKEMALDEARLALKQPQLQWPTGTEKAKLLEASFYIPRSNKNADLIADIDAGVASDVSIGFQASDRSAIGDGNGGVVAYRLLAPGEALEGSLVWLGAQPGAHVAKHFTKASQHSEDNAMDIKELQAALDAALNENKTLKASSTTNAAKAKVFDDLEGLLGEQLLKEPETIAMLVTDGKAHRDETVDEIVKHQRTLGLVTGDDDATVAKEKAQYTDWPLAKLKAFAHKLAGSIPNGSMDGSNPNGNAGNTPERIKQPAADANHKAFTPFNNPAINTGLV